MTETERLESLSKFDGDIAKFAPGTFGAHEALHTASLILDNISRYLLEHPTIIADTEYYNLAYKAYTATFELYQAIGEKHLQAE